MDDLKWNSVLIEWVNCLKLCKNIQDVKELRTGDFFNNLQKVIMKSPDSTQDILTFIFKLLKQHYPYYTFQNAEEVHLIDVPEMDLKAITSLLMHYTCIYDRRDVLTSPLCHNLSQSTQLIIKNFLQKMNTNVTSEILNKVIQQCIAETVNNVTNKWLVVDTLTLERNSPLQDLLKTPLSKTGGKLQEKDRIIAALRSDLELERYEKADLQEDLKSHIEKNKKLEKQLVQRNSEISRLRSEILALENRTPPHYQDMDSREIQKCLRSEIQSLEQYIQQIENEQEEIVKEKDQVKEKLRSVESQCTIWQEKFFEIERNFENLTEHADQQEEELKELKTNCAELKALLDEYRIKSPNDSSVFENLTSTEQSHIAPDMLRYEDLACSVVEVQLRDAQKQNDELKVIISDMENVSEQLRTDLEVVKNQLDTSKQECDTLSTLNNQLQNTLQELTVEHTEIKQKLLESRETVKSLKDLNDVQSEQLISSQHSCEQLSSKIEQMNKVLEALEVERDCLKLELEKCQESCNILSSEGKSLSTALKDSVEQIQLLNTTKEELLNEVKSKEIESALMEKQLSELELAMKTERELREQERIHFKNLQVVCDNVKANVEQLESENSLLNHKLESAVQSAALLKNENTNLESQLEVYGEMNATLQRDKEEISSLYKILQVNFHETKNNLATLENYSKRLEKELDYLKTDHSRIQVQFETVQVRLTELMSENDELRAERKSAQISSLKIIQEIKAELDQNIESCRLLQEDKNELLNKIKTLDSNLTTCHDNFSTTKEELAVALETSQQLQSEIDCLQTKLCDLEALKQSELKLAEEQIDSLKYDLEQAVNQLSMLTDQINHLTNDGEILKKNYCSLSQEKELLLSKLENSNYENSLLQEKLAMMDSTMKSTTEMLDKNQEEIKTLQLINEELRNISRTQFDKLKMCEIQSEELREKHVAEIETLANLLRTSQSDNELLLKEKIELNSVLTNLENNFNNWNETTVDELEEINFESPRFSKVLMVIKNIMQKSKVDVEKITCLDSEVARLNEVVNNLQTEMDVTSANFQESYEKCKSLENFNQELLEKLQMLDDALVNEQNKSQSQENEIGALQNRLTETTKLCHDLDMRRLEIERTISEMEKEKLDIISNYDELIQSVNMKLEDTVNENRNLLDCKNDLIQKLNLLETQLVEAEQHLQRSKVDTNVLQSQLEDELKQLKSDNEILKEQISTLINVDKEKSAVVIQLEATEEKCDNLTNYNEELLSKVERLQIQYETVQMELSETIQNLELATKLSEELKCGQSLINEELKESKMFSEKCQANLQECYIQNKKYNDDLEKSNNILCELNGEKKLLISELEKLNAELQDCKKQINEQNEIVSRISTDNQMLREEKELLVKDVDKLREDHQVSERHSHQLTEELEKISSEKQTVKDENKLLIEKLKHLEERYGISSQLIDEGNGKLEQLSTERQQLREEVKVLTEEYKELEQKHQHCKEHIDELTGKVEHFSAEKQILNNKIDMDEILSMECQEKLKSLEETVQDYEITISGLKCVIDNNLQSLTDLKNEKTLLENQKDEFKNRLLKLVNQEAESLSLNEENQDDLIIEHIRTIIDERRGFEDMLCECNAQIGELKNHLGNIQKLVVDETKSAPLAETIDVKFLCEKINDILDVKDKLSNNLLTLENEKLDLIKQVDKLNLEKGKIEQENNELGNMNKLLQAELTNEKARVADLTEQKSILDKELDNMNSNKIKNLRSVKENILGSSTRANVLTSREEELKKDNMLLKKKLVLTESSKNNLEKVIKDLRLEKKKIIEERQGIVDQLTEKLLQELKEEHAKVLHEKDSKYNNLLMQYEQLQNTKSIENDKKLKQDLQNIREAYGNVMSANSKLELENATLKRVIEERNNEICDLSHVKEAYEKLLEENNKYMTEFDTLKYKRMRDKEEFVRLLKKEREESQTRESRKVHEVRTEYEGKLEKMKEKMLQLYRDEVNKEVQKLKTGQSEKGALLKTISDLKSELFESEQRIQLLEMERDMLKTKQQALNEHQIMKYNQRELPSTDRDSIFLKAPRESMAPPQSYVKITKITTREICSNDDSRRASTLPKTMEMSVASRRTSIGSIGQSLQMEDEEDLFNDKYLMDMKEGRCVAPMGSDSNRFSELAWRNSMVPPHLKSSYPAEIQFVSPTRFKDDDIKTGFRLEFEDSLCKLLPGEKPRKKDFGTTSYKKPGPPTPSKNGGRLSLQGNEIHPLREHAEAKTPKRSTPSRIRALFTSRNNSRDTTESHNNMTPNRGRRLNIFRKPK